MFPLIFVISNPSASPPDVFNVGGQWVGAPGETFTTIKSIAVLMVCRYESNIDIVVLIEKYNKPINKQNEKQQPRQLKYFFSDILHVCLVKHT